MTKKTILIDDEALAIAELSALLATHPEIEIIGSCKRAQEAIQLINDLRPDLIFLDINMPGMNGFELLEQLDHIPSVIFATAYDQYAIKAFEFNALDYLLKPINPDRLADALHRTGTKDSAKSTPEKLSLEKKIFIKDGEKCYFVAIKDIYLLESVGNYVKVYFEDKKPLLHKSLSYLESRLPEDTFFRANRQFAFNLNFIEKIIPHFNSTLHVELESGQIIELSQRQSAKFRDLTGV